MFCDIGVNRRCVSGLPQPHQTVDLVDEGSWATGGIVAKSSADSGVPGLQAHTTPVRRFGIGAIRIPFGDIFLWTVICRSLGSVLLAFRALQKVVLANERA